MPGPGWLRDDARVAHSGLDAMRMPDARRAWQKASGFWPTQSFAACLADRARTDPDLDIFVADGTRFTAPDILDASLRLAAGLRACGVGAGDVVTWQLPSWIEGVWLVFALDRIGAISNPVLPIYRERELGHIVREARSRLLLTCGRFRGFDHRALAQSVCPPGTRAVVVRDEPLDGQVEFADLMAAPPDREPAAEPDPAAAHSLFYTSGTTAEPKGVVHCAASLSAFLQLQGGLLPDEAGRVSILWFPLTHIGGVCAFALQPVVAGTRVVFVEPFDPEESLRLIEQERVTQAGAPTPILQALLASPAFSPQRVESVRVSGIGATDVPPELVGEVGRKLGAFVYRSYGLTECPMATAGRRGDPEEALVGTDGRPLPGVEVRLAGGNAADEGEVELRGPQLCLGYLDPARTHEAFTADGFLRTGDLARRDAGGFLRITGRSKEIIVRKGENLSARAIEEALLSLPQIADAAVFAVPDPESGECACACVVAAGAEQPALSELAAELRGAGVMPHLIPERLLWVGGLPRTPTGKVRKHELRDAWLAGL